MEEETTRQIAARVREIRKRRGYSGSELGQRMTKAGVRWDRMTVTKFETGHRQNVTVNELLALARVLDVAPIHLLVPVEDQTFHVTPNEACPPSDARAWIRGEQPLPGTDLRIFRTEAPMRELGR